MEGPCYVSLPRPELYGHRGGACAPDPVLRPVRHEPRSADLFHAAFAGRHKLPFTLLSDRGGKVRKSYGVPAVLGVVPGRVT